MINFNKKSSATLAVCLLLGFQIVNAEVFTFTGGNPVPQPPGTTFTFPSGNWNPLTDLNGLSTGGGNTWTFTPFPPTQWSGWTTPQPWSTAAWSGWSTGSPTGSPWTTAQPWSSWTSQQPGGAGAGLSSFTRLNGNCPGNYLGAVTQLTIDACAGACLSTPACAGFSFNLQSAYPQCILKNAVCSSPDSAGVFTFFARNGYTPQTGGGQAPAFMPPYGFPAGNGFPYPIMGPVAVPAYPHAHYSGGFPPMGGMAPMAHRIPIWKTGNARQFKRPVGAQYFEMPANCSGPILRGPYTVVLEQCAEDCSAAKFCTGFSFDNATSSCVIHAGVCQTLAISSQWSYFARGGGHIEMVADTVTEQPKSDDLHDLLAVAKPTPSPTPTSSSSRNHQFPYNLNPMDMLNRFEQMSGNCQGNDLAKEMSVPLDECARMCLEAYNCAGFSFNILAREPSEFQCRLKSAACNEPSEGTPFRFFRRRSLNVFVNPRFRPSQN